MLSIVSTPIGNLGDITLRAIEVLKSCDVIVCEDTRVTGILIKHLEIPKKEMIAMHSYTDENRINGILMLLKRKKHVALVSDAGTPAISDPGYRLISKAREKGYDMEVIPGPSAFLSALSISGLPINQFSYLGFLPLKKGRKKLLESFIEEDRTIVFYESVHRIEKALSELSVILKDQPDRPVVIGRELTKLHEEVVSATVSELPDVAKSIMKKGEFVVVVGPSTPIKKLIICHEGSNRVLQ